MVADAICQASVPGAEGQDLQQQVPAVEQIASICGAGSACGSCRGLVAELAGGAPELVKVPGATTMMVTSAVALLLALAWWPLSSVEMAQSVQDSWRRFDALWRNDFARQVTGFSLLGVTAIGMLFSLRKRLSKFSWGSYGMWRAFHGVLGTLALVAMVVHTGLRLGSNLNLMLGLCFLAAGGVRSGRRDCQFHGGSSGGANCDSDSTMAITVGSVASVGYLAATRF